MKRRFGSSGKKIDKKRVGRMAPVFPHLSWWLWSGKSHGDTVPGGSHVNSSSDPGLGMREPDHVNCSTVYRSKMHSSPRRVRRKWQSREERKVDREFDVVLVPSDGVCLSYSESDGSDWSIGWLEPHDLDFLGSDDSEGSFAVLVPCYAHLRNDLLQDSKNTLFSGIMSANLQDDLSPGNKNFIEEWLSSLKST